MPVCCWRVSGVTCARCVRCSGWVGLCFIAPRDIVMSSFPLILLDSCGYVLSLPSGFQFPPCKFWQKIAPLRMTGLTLQNGPGQMELWDCCWAFGRGQAFYKLVMEFGAQCFQQIYFAKRSMHQGRRYARKDARRYVRRNVNRNTKENVRKEWQKICQKQCQKKTSEDMSEKNVRRYIT